MAARQMALTPSLVAQIHHVVEDPGPDPNLVYHTQEDYDALVRHLLISHAPDEDLWLFAYGSLIWKPEVDHVEERRCTWRNAASMTAISGAYKPWSQSGSKPPPLLVDPTRCRPFHKASSRKPRAFTRVGCYQRRSIHKWLASHLPIREGVYSCLKA